MFQDFWSFLSNIAEFSLEKGYLLWGGHVVIPQSLHKVVLIELHREQRGVMHEGAG